MPISFDKELVFVHIPKCAGSSIEEALNIDYDTGLRSADGIRCSQLQISNIDDLQNVERIYTKNTSPQHLPASVLKKIIPHIFEEYTKFAVVRNPYDRIVSEYLYTKHKYHMTFDNFIKYVFNLPKFERHVEFDSHMNTQSSFVYESNKLLVDKIFKFENVNDVFNWLQLPEIHINSTNRTTPWQEYYTPELMQLVYNFYKQDFDNFNYPYNP